MAGNRGPYHTWERDTEADKQHWKEIVEEENTKRAIRTAENQALAYDKGTWQHAALNEFNIKIEQINSSEGRTGRNKKRKRKPEGMFKEDKLVFTSKGKL